MVAILLSAEAKYVIWTITVVCIFIAPISVLGAIGNIINIKTFIRLGISDGVNMSLASLAVSDFLFLVAACIDTTIVMLHCVEELSSFKVWLPDDPVVAFSVFTSLGSGFYANSMLVTTFITVVRCLAVANPLKYRHLLSWQTTIKIISMFTVLSLTSSILLLVFVEIPPKFDSNVNTTRPSLLVFPERTLMKDIIYGTRDAFLPLASQIIVGICVVIMTRYLRRASQFRLQLSKNLSKNNSVIKDAVRDKKAMTDESHSAKLFGKELQAVQQMLLIAVVYSLCNMPKFVFNMTQIIMSDFYMDGRYSALYLTTNIIRELIQSVNASVTIFIYWKYNSKFRINMFVTTE